MAILPSSGGWPAATALLTKGRAAKPRADARCRGALLRLSHPDEKLFVSSASAYLLRLKILSPIRDPNAQKHHTLEMGDVQAAYAVLCAGQDVRFLPLHLQQMFRVEFVLCAHAPVSPL
jgi:hypothetical protein